MTREMFLSELKKALHALAPVEQEEAVTYYDELLDDLMQEEGLTQEAAMARMDTVASIAERILEERPAAASQTAQTSDVNNLPGIREINAKPLSVNHLTIRARNIPIIMRAGGADEIILRYPEDDKTEFDFSLENGVLSLVQRPGDIIDLMTFRIFYRQPYEIELTVPRDFAAAADVKTGNSAIRIENITFWGALTAGTSNGNLKAENVTAKDIHLTTSNSSVEASQVTSQNDVILKSSNGRITATQVGCEKTLRLTTSNARIECLKCRAGTFSLSTSNGRISATLPGKMKDYAIASRTSNGSNSLPAHSDGGPGHLEAVTSNGSIAVGFEN